jgi:hypothetical protein
MKKALPNKAILDWALATNDKDVSINIPAT